MITIELEENILPAGAIDSLASFDGPGGNNDPAEDDEGIDSNEAREIGGGGDSKQGIGGKGDEGAIGGAGLNSKEESTGKSDPKLSGNSGGQGGAGTGTSGSGSART